VNALIYRAFSVPVRYTFFGICSSVLNQFSLATGYFVFFISFLPLQERALKSDFLYIFKSNRIDLIIFILRYKTLQPKLTDLDRS